MIKAWRDYIKDPDRDIKDRLLVFVMTIITFVLVGLALLWIILGESLIHHLIIAGAFSVMFPTRTAYLLRAQTALSVPLQALLAQYRHLKR